MPRLPVATQSDLRPESDARRVLAASTVNRKRVADALGLTRASIDKALEDSGTTDPLSRLVAWLEANLEDAPPERALAPIEWLRGYFDDRLMKARPGAGRPVDLLRESSGVMASCSSLLQDVSKAIADGRLSDAEANAMDRKLLLHEAEVAQLRRELVAVRRRVRRSA